MGGGGRDRLQRASGREDWAGSDGRRGTGPLRAGGTSRTHRCFEDR